MPLTAHLAQFDYDGQAEGESLFAALELARFQSTGPVQKVLRDIDTGLPKQFPYQATHLAGRVKTAVTDYAALHNFPAIAVSVSQGLETVELDQLAAASEGQGDVVRIDTGAGDASQTIHVTVYGLDAFDEKGQLQHILNRLQFMKAIMVMLSTTDMIGTSQVLGNQLARQGAAVQQVQRLGKQIDGLSRKIGESLQNGEPISAKGINQNLQGIVNQLARMQGPATPPQMQALIHVMMAQVKDLPHQLPILQKDRPIVFQQKPVAAATGKQEARVASNITNLRQPATRFSANDDRPQRQTGVVINFREAASQIKGDRPASGLSVANGVNTPGRLAEARIAAKTEGRATPITPKAEGKEAAMSAKGQVTKGEPPAGKPDGKAEIAHGKDTQAADAKSPKGNIAVATGKEHADQVVKTDRAATGKSDAPLTKANAGVKGDVIPATRGDQPAKSEAASKSELVRSAKADATTAKSDASTKSDAIVPASKGEVAARTDPAAKSDTTGKTDPSHSTKNDGTMAKADAAAKTDGVSLSGKGDPAIKADAPKDDAVHPNIRNEPAVKVDHAVKADAPVAKGDVATRTEAGNKSDEVHGMKAGPAARTDPISKSNISTVKSENDSSGVSAAATAGVATAFVGSEQTTRTEPVAKSEFTARIDAMPPAGRTDASAQADTVAKGHVETSPASKPDTAPVGETIAHTPENPARQESAAPRTEKVTPTRGEAVVPPEQARQTPTDPETGKAPPGNNPATSFKQRPDAKQVDPLQARTPAEETQKAFRQEAEHVCGPNCPIHGTKPQTTADQSRQGSLDDFLGPARNDAQIKAPEQPHKQDDVAREDLAKSFRQEAEHVCGPNCPIHGTKPQTTADQSRQGSLDDFLGGAKEDPAAKAPDQAKTVFAKADAEEAKAKFAESAEHICGPNCPIHGGKAHAANNDRAASLDDFMTVTKESAPAAEQADEKAGAKTSTASQARPALSGSNPNVSHSPKL